MARPPTRKQVIERSNQEGSQEASSGAGAGQASIYITRDEMEAMLKRQEEMMQAFLRQFAQAGNAGAQVHGAGSEALNQQAEGVAQ